MNNKQLLSGIAFSFLLSTAFAHAVEIQIIDKTYDENQIRYSRTLQSDLDKAESTQTPYHAIKPTTQPVKAVAPKAPPPKTAVEIDPVYTAPTNTSDSTTLQEDLDEGVLPPPTDDSLSIDSDKTVPDSQSAVEPIQKAPTESEKPEATPSVEQVTPPAKPVIMEDETLAPSEREPILLGNMSDESLKKELGISDSPAEADIQSEAGVEENFTDDAVIITAPPAHAIPNNSLNTIQ